MSDQTRYWAQTFPIPRSLKQIGNVNRVLLIRFTFFLILLLLIVSLWPHTWLLARDDRSDTHLGMWRIRPEENFGIIYTHSVQLSPVTERYHIDKSGDLILDETLFSTYGAGLPATTPYDFEITEDGFRIFNIQLKMDHLVYRTGAVRANHRLLIRDQDIPFLNFSNPGQAVEFISLNAPLFYYVIKEVIK